MSPAAAPRAFNAIIPAPFGALGVRVSGVAIEGLALLPGASPQSGADSAFAAQVAKVLTAYLGDPQVPLAMPVAPRGTAFQQRVWQALRHIPRGQTLTYGELARALGSSARAVGGACGANPIAIVIPCHRVVAARGLGGFSGSTDGQWLVVKRWLLGHEGVAGIGR